MAKRPKNNTRGKSKKKAAPKRSPKKAKAKPKTAAAGKAVKKTTRTGPARTVPARTVVVVTVPQHITLDLPPVLHDRLKALSHVMGLPVEGVMRQALTEFAETWEDHHRTVSSLAESSDRMMVVDKE